MSEAATGAARMALPERLVGLRLHSRRQAPGTPVPERVRWLVQLGERNRRDAEAHAALLRVGSAVQSALRDLPRAVQGRLDEVAILAVEIGLAVAREVVGEALDRGHVDPTPVVARCLRELVTGSDSARVAVRLHPEDLGPVLERLAAHQDLQASLGQADLRPDPAIGRGAVVVESGAGRLRAEPREALERIAAEVRREAAR